MSDALPVTEIQ